VMMLNQGVWFIHFLSTNSKSNECKMMLATVFEEYAANVLPKQILSPPANGEKL